MASGAFHMEPQSLAEARAFLTMSTRHQQTTRRQVRQDYHLMMVV